jgi:hypothetical protein
VKVSDIHACTQELICGGGVKISLITLGPLQCLIPIEMEHGGECIHKRSTKEINNTMFPPCLILDVEMELLQVCGPLLVEVVLQHPFCLYELQRLVIKVGDCLLS